MWDQTRPGKWRDDPVHERRAVVVHLAVQSLRAGESRVHQVTVVIPEILPARWWQNILHNQRAFMLKGALLFKDRVILTDVPYHLTR